MLTPIRIEQDPTFMFSSWPTANQVVGPRPPYHFIFSSRCLGKGGCAALNLPLVLDQPQWLGSSGSIASRFYMCKTLSVPHSCSLQNLDPPNSLTTCVIYSICSLRRPPLRNISQHLRQCLEPNTFRLCCSWDVGFEHIQAMAFTVIEVL